MKPILQSSITFLLTSLTSAGLLASTGASQPTAKVDPITIPMVTVGDPGNLNDAPDDTRNLVSVTPVYQLNPDGTPVTRTITHQDGTVSTVPVNATNPDGSNQYTYHTNSQTITLHGNGAVATTFLIGKYDVTASQYCTFLNAVAATSDPYGLYDVRMGTDTSTNVTTNVVYYTNITSSNGLSSTNVTSSNVVSTNVVQNQPSIIRTTKTNADGTTSFTYSIKPGKDSDGNSIYANLPIVYVSWFSAARFCNWMHNGQPLGNEDATTTETGAYNLNGAMTDVAGDINRPDTDYSQMTPGAKYFIPTEDMWVKAAYYKRSSDKGAYWNYPTQSDVPPVNTPTGWIEKSTTNCANYFIASNTDESKDWYHPEHWNYQYANGGFSPFLTPVGKYTGSPGPYGTFDMGGNCYQWTSKNLTDTNALCGSRVIRGGSYKFVVKDDLNRTTCSTENPALALDFVGFRIAAPAPNTSLPLEGASLNTTQSATPTIPKNQPFSREAALPTQ